MAGSILRRLKFDNDTIRKVCRLVKWHDDRPLPEERQVRRAIARIGADLFPFYLQVQRADMLAQSLYQREEKRSRLEQVEKLYRKITDEKQCVSLKEMRISGKELLELGAQPGPGIGRILDELLEEILEEPSRNRSEWLRKRAEEKLEEMAGHPDQPEREAGICKNNRNRNE